MMVVMEGNRPVPNLGVALDNLMSAFAIVTEQYDKGQLSHDDWHRIRAARQSIEEAIICVKPFCGPAAHTNPAS